MLLCEDCEYYDNGRCKKEHVERHMSERDILNGWPKANPEEKACGEYEPKP